MLKTEPRDLVFVGLHLASTVVTVVELVGRPIVIPCFAHDENIVTTAERIREDGYGAEVDVGIVARRLPTG